MDSDSGRSTCTDDSEPIVSLASPTVEEVVDYFGLERIKTVLENGTTELHARNSVCKLALRRAGSRKQYFMVDTLVDSVVIKTRTYGADLFGLKPRQSKQLDEELAMISDAMSVSGVPRPHY